MSHISQLRRPGPDDEAIEAIVRGRPVDARFDAWVAFARQVRAAAVDLPGPGPSDELAAILRGDVDVTREREPVDVGRIASVAARVAALGAAKVVLGATLAAASVTGAGAAGVLPGPAGDAVRSAIETVTPVQFDDRGDRDGDGDPGAGEGRDGFGDDVSSDATGESDGERGVDGTTISEEAPGSELRPDQAGSPGGGPVQPDSTGLDRADQTPAAPHVPDAPGPGAGAEGGNGGGGGDGVPSGPVPSTVPSVPEQAERDDRP